jgi:Ca2+-binding EF-hand superfamily protein
MRKGALLAATVGTVLAAGISVFAMRQEGTGQQDQPRVRPGARVARTARMQWRRLDKDGSGTISREEWIRDPQVFDRADANKDGALTPDEARQAAQARVRQRQQERWKRLDQNADGVLSKDEWRRRPEAFDRLDANRDGQLTPQELQARLGRRRR